MTQRFPIAHLIAERNPQHIAEDMKVSERTVQRWIERGIDWRHADDFAAIILAAPAVFVFGPDFEAAAGYRFLASIPDLPDDYTGNPTRTHGQLGLFEEETNATHEESHDEGPAR